MTQEAFPKAADDIIQQYKNNAQELEIQNLHNRIYKKNNQNQLLNNSGTTNSKPNIYHVPKTNRYDDDLASHKQPISESPPITYRSYRSGQVNQSFDRSTRAHPPALGNKKNIHINI